MQISFNSFYDETGPGFESQGGQLSISEIK
jgi:hypothetical protein